MAKHERNLPHCASKAASPHCNGGMKGLSRVKKHWLPAAASATVLVLSVASSATASGFHESTAFVPQPAPAIQAADGWHAGIPPNATPWTGKVNPDNALPEYPRPQLTRPR